MHTIAPLSCVIVAVAVVGSCNKQAINHSFFYFFVCCVLVGAWFVSAALLNVCCACALMHTWFCLLIILSFAEFASGNRDLLACAGAGGSTCAIVRTVRVTRPLCMLVVLVRAAVCVCACLLFHF